MFLYTGSHLSKFLLCGVNFVQPLYMLNLDLRYKNALGAWSGSITSVLGKCLLHSCLKSLNELSPGKARPRRVGFNIESPMQLLHSQCGANFIVYVKPLTMLSPRSTPSYNDHLALLNWYLRVVLETLPYATFWCHKGLCKPNVPILCRDGIHLNHKGLSIGVTGVPFYALWEIFPFLFHPRGIS